MLTVQRVFFYWFLNTQRMAIHIKNTTGFIPVSQNLVADKFYEIVHRL